MELFFLQDLLLGHHGPVYAHRLCIQVELEAILTTAAEYIHLLLLLIAVDSHIMLTYRLISRCPKAMAAGTST
jgi:hypothetical protein